MGKKVLIADRARMMRTKFVKDALESGGYEVVGDTDSIRECLQLAQSLAPDIVITEVILRETESDTDQTGMTLTKELLKQNPNVAVVFLTTMTQDAMRRDALAAGAKGFLSKGVIHPAQKLLDELEKVLNA